MRPLFAWLLILGACGSPADPGFSFQVSVRAQDHDWSHYACTVIATLRSLSGSIVVSDSLTVSAGEERSFDLWLERPGEHAAEFQLRWEGMPASDVLAGIWSDTLTVPVPGAIRIDCP